MHIKLEPCPDVEAGAEVYHAVLCEDDEEETKVALLGHIQRAADGADVWELRSSSDEEGEPKITFEATTFEELQKAVRKNFKPMPLKPNRIASVTMDRFVDDLLDPVIALAEETDSLSGFFAALVDVLAREIVTRFQGTTRTEAADKMVAQLRERIEAHATRIKFEDTMRTAVKMIFQAAKVGSDDDGDAPETKH